MKNVIKVMYTVNFKNKYLKEKNMYLMMPISL